MNRFRTITTICALATALAGVATLTGCQPGIQKSFEGPLQDGSSAKGTATCYYSSTTMKVNGYKLQWGKEPNVVEAIASYRTGDRNKNSVADTEYASVGCKEGTTDIVYPHWSDKEPPTIDGPCKVDPEYIRRTAETLALKVCELGKEQSTFYTPM